MTGEFVVLGDAVVDPFLDKVVVMGDWVEQAACAGVDPDLFFPDRGASLAGDVDEHVDVADARRVCAGCPVRVECLEYALEAGEKFGVWGGTSEKERRAMRRQRLAVRRGAA
jgi:WhiB family redox-sensing transcriptional regulator